MTTYDAHADDPTIDAHADDTTRAEHRLRWVLRANATTSALAGVVGLAAAPWCVEQLGTQSVGWTRAIGAALLLFALGVADASRADRAALVSRARQISVADASWVVASIVAGFVVDLTTAGRVVDAVQAIGVADFALLQWWLARRASA